MPDPLDLTLTISKDLPVFPGSPGPQFIPWESIIPDGYNLELLFLSSHSGTHMDAPYHFLEKGQTIDKIPVNRLAADALLIKVKRRSKTITKHDILKFESKYGKIPDNSTVVFATGWSANLKKPSYFKKNPGLSVSAAKYLASKHTNLVGIDSPSIDSGGSGFPVHKILSKAGVLIVENLINLEKINRIHFRLIVLPLKLQSATGSPVRAIAL